MSEISHLFQAKGKVVRMKPNERFSLKNKKKLYLVEEGSLLLFKVKKEGGKRALLSALRENELVFPFETKCSDEVMAHAEKEVVLWELDLDTFASALTSPSLHASFLPKFEKWILQFSPLLEADIEAEVDHFAEDHQVLYLKEGKVFSVSTASDQKILWANVGKEVIELLGPYGLKIVEAHQSFPLMKHQFFLALDKGEIELKTTGQVIGEGNWQEGLKEFHAFILHFLAKRETLKEAEEKKRFEVKQTLQADTLHQSFNEMAAILKEDVEGKKTSREPLFLASLLVGQASGIEIKLPDQKPFKGTVKEQLIRLSENSDMRARLCHLDHHFWKKDVGPLLAFYGKEKHPVALLQNRFGCYEIHDPLHQKVRSVNDKTAALLSSKAYRFYPSFSDELHRGKRVIGTFLKRSKKDLLLLFSYGLIAALIALFPPFAMALLFNHAIPEANAPLVFQIFIGLLIAALSSSLFIYFRSLLLARIGGIAAAQVQASLWDRLLKLPANFFRRFSGGDLLTRVWIMDQLGPLFSSSVARIFLTGIFAFFYLIVMAVYSIPLTLVGLALIASAGLITYLSVLYKAKMQKKTLALQGRINGALVQILSGIAKLRISGAENNAFAYWARLYAKSKECELKGQHAQGFVAATMTAFPLISFFAIFGVMIHLEQAGGISTGAFLAFNAAFLTFSAAIFDVGNTLMQTAHIFPLAKRSGVILEEEQELLHSKAHPGKLTGEIRIDQLTFSYDGSATPVLQEVSLEVHRHEMVGIVGPSGCGKSTLIRLILGFETAKSGAIYYNGKDLSHLNTNEVRKQIGVVLQGGGIIAGSLYQNIVAGGRYNQEEIDRALLLSGFHRDLRLFPMGLHTVVPMNGETLSGGQKQRLLIARALLPRPKILLLDEATSALDNESQNEITKNIDELDITRIVIAHRLSTIRHADRIYVIEKGRIIQAGTFDALANEPGLFAEMLKRQKL